MKKIIMFIVILGIMAVPSWATVQQTQTAIAIVQMTLTAQVPSATITPTSTPTSVAKGSGGVGISSISPVSQVLGGVPQLEFNFIPNGATFTHGFLALDIDSQFPVPVLAPGAAGSISFTATNAVIGNVSISTRRIIIPVTSMNGKYGSVKIKYNYNNLTPVMTPLAAGNYSFKFVNNSVNALEAQATPMATMIYKIYTATTVPSATFTPTFTPIPTKVPFIPSGASLSQNAKMAGNYTSINSGVIAAATPGGAAIYTYVAPGDGWLVDVTASGSGGVGVIDAAVIDGTTVTNTVVNMISNCNLIPMSQGHTVRFYIMQPTTASTHILNGTFIKARP